MKENIEEQAEIVAKNIIHLIYCIARKINNDPTIHENQPYAIMQQAFGD